MNFTSWNVETPPKKRKTCEDMRDSLRKMGRKTSGSKADLEDRLETVLNTNDKGWLRNVSGHAGSWCYLASGAHRDVHKGTYNKGPRKGEECVSKVFKTGSVYADVFFEEDIKATREVSQSINAFNKTGSSEKKVYLNEPEIWVDEEPDSRGRNAKSLVEPFIKGEYKKFNSNTAYVAEGYATMQALSHFSYHFSAGKRLVCDLQGGYYGDFYVLTDPVVCSQERAFGATDLGQAGIENFFSHHRCNGMCRPEWRKPARTARHFAPVAGTTFLPR